MNYKIIVAAIVVGTLLVGTLSYFIWLRSAPKTLVSLYPKEVNANVNGNFTVFIDVSHVSDLYGWQVNLEWNSSMLELADIIEGPFLKSKGQTFFSYTTNKNKVAIVCTLQGNVSGVSGEGTLAEVKFKVKQHGICTIQIYSSKLLNSNEEEISHSVSNCRIHA